ncbi:MAG: protein kinase [Gemmatimonadales bacterium]|nr:protein kinase [Gemmatimonadales bacterium]
MTTEAVYLPIGTVLKDRYEILREIGRGGYSVVFAARDRELGTDVAIKLLVPPPAVAHIARERMRREVQVVRGLSHQHIVAVHDFVEDGPQSFIVMELVDGPDLAIRVTRQHPLVIDDVARIGVEIAGALAFAHARGVLHRDVKPQNILLDPGGRARLTDFGSAKLDGQMTMTQTGGLVGTIPYSAPEVLSGQRGDARADIYALGMTLYFALTGQLPGSPASRLPPASAPGGHHPREVRGEIPEWLDTIVARATAGEPSRRFHAASDLTTALVERERGTLPVWSEGLLVEFCLSCGSSDTFGMTPCPECSGRRPKNADTLVFVVPPSKRKQRLEVALGLASMSSTPLSQTDLRHTARGRRAVVRIPAHHAASVIRHLAARNIPAQAVPKAYAWAAVPLPLYALAGAIVVVGSLAGMLTLPALLWTSPVVAGLLVVGGHRSAHTPILTASPGRSGGFPDALESRVTSTMAALGPGTARRMVADITTLSQAVLAELPETDAAEGGGSDLRAQVVELFASASEVAQDLGNLDQALSLLESHRERFASKPAKWLDALSQCERARDRHVQQLLDVLSILARLKAEESTGQADQSEQLAELTRTLERDMEARIEAEAEIEELLALEP